MQQTTLNAGFLKMQLVFLDLACRQRNITQRVTTLIAIEHTQLTQLNYSQPTRKDFYTALYLFMPNYLQLVLVESMYTIYSKTPKAKGYSNTNKDMLPINTLQPTKNLVYYKAQTLSYLGISFIERKHYLTQRSTLQKCYPRESACILTTLALV